jgi:hypothetical protein
VNFAFVVVVVAAVSGIASEVALRGVAPESASALALCIMAFALLGAAWRLGKTGLRASDYSLRANTQPPPSAAHSIQPV